MALQLEILFTVFFFALGACVGSFLNVVIWRLPNRGREVIFLKQRGRLTLSWPPSHCPVCDSPIRWYQNIPVVSWVMLKGHCAVCRTDIPVRYPLVELGTAVLFVGFYLAYFMGHWQAGFTHLPMGPQDWGNMPQAAAIGLHLFFIGALLAAAAIDADLFIIPLSIPALLAVIGLAGAVVIDHPAIWKLSIQDDWWAARPILGAAVGVVVANILMWIKVLPRSFSGEEVELQRIEAEAKAAAKKGDAKKEDDGKEEPLAPPPKLTRFGISVAATGVLIVLAIIAWIVLSPKAASLITVIGGIAIFLIGVLARDEGQLDVTDEVMEEISSPFARREVLKELAFLLVPVACAALAYVIPIDVPATPWMARLLGSLLGLLAGGGVIWLIRILGTLLFNKEAMGLGDVHLMAAAGTILGPELVVFAFFFSAFIAIPWIVVLKISGKPNAIPFGPWLSVASILSLLVGNPFLAWYVAKMLH